ncbi:MAG TPA: HAD family hydrolase [Bacilli bacterium]
MKQYFSPEQIKVVFFDINGTLMRTKKSGDESFLAALNDFTGRWDHEEADWNPQEVLTQYKQELRTQQKILSGHSKEEIQRASLRQTLKPYPFAINDESVKAWISRIQNKRTSHCELLPHVQTTLSKLSGHYKLAVISNSSKASIISAFKLVGLDQLIPAEHICTSLKKKWKKPNTAIFRYAYKQMGVLPSQAIMVGNSWKNDIMGAAKAGMDAVWLRATPKKLSSLKRVGGRKIIIIKEFQELLELFK